MPKAFFTGFCLLMFSALFAQTQPGCVEGPCLYYKIMFFDHRYEALQVYRYQEAYNLPPVPDTKLKRDYIYQYIHNGDNIKMATDIFTNDPRVSKTWFRNFDMGNFANVTFELSPDHKNIVGSALQCTGKLIFFKVFHHRPLGKLRKKAVVSM